MQYLLNDLGLLYDQMAGHLHEIDDSESPEELEKRLRDRVSELKREVEAVHQVNK